MPGPIVLAQPPPDTSFPGLSEIGEQFTSSSGLMLLGALGILGLLALLPGGAGKAKLARSHWATSHQQRRANHLAIQQIKAQKNNAVALSIGVPGSRSSLHFPDVQRGVAVLGAPGSGKTYSVITPFMVSALLQGFPVIVYDYKYPGQTADLAPLAQHLGYDVHIFAPGYLESSTCNLLDFMTSAADIAAARQIARVINSNAARTGETHHSDDPFFSDAGEQITVAALSLAKGSPYPDLAMAHAILRLPGLAERLHTAVDLPLWSRLNFDQLLAVADSERTAASILGTATGYFTRFMDANLLRSVIGTTTLPLTLTGRQLIVIGMDKQRRDAVSPLVASVLHMLIVNNTHASRQAPLIISLDELPTLYLPSLVQWINEHREQGLALILGAQNLAQLEKTYGPTATRAIFGACATKALFNPGETVSAEVFARLLGDEEVRYTDPARSRSKGKTTISRSLQRRTRKLFEPNQFLTLPPGMAVLMNPGYGNRRQGALPVKQVIKVSPSITGMTDTSRAAWNRLRPLLIQRSQRPAIAAADLEVRMSHAKALLPASSSDKNL
ncbi:MAG: type IV secretory system conjugative DNA transfer family protein [Leptolyngbya sp. SIOISBB]|nr:type IV secretory system conjugative DNA transfer family protein [Leptolyngbya sp. SIOISBB]